MNPQPHPPSHPRKASSQTETGPQKSLAAPAVPKPDFAQLIKKHRNLAGVLKEQFKPLFEKFPPPRFAGGPTPEATRLRFERVFRPWPKWVFRLAAEIWHVNYPTVPKEVVFQTLRVLNVVLFFRCPTDPARMSVDVFDRINPSAIQVILVGIIGHGYEHFQAARKKLDADFAAGTISEQEYAAQIKELSAEGVEATIREAFTTWAEDKNLDMMDVTRAVDEARRSTFDEKGFPRETPLTPVYRAMLSNWIIVENMTGPKELTSFLAPQLKGASKTATGEQTRVATMCSRLGVRFRGRVKRN